MAPDLLADRAEQLGPRRQIEHADPVRALQRGAQTAPAVIGLGVHGDIGQLRQELPDEVGGAVGRRDMGDDRLLGQRAVRVFRQRPPRDADHTRRLGHLPVGEAMEEGWDQLADGEVAGGAKDDDVERLDGDDAGDHVVCSRGRSGAGLTVAMAGTTVRPLSRGSPALVVLYVVAGHQL